MTDIGAGLARHWPQALSIRTTRGRAAAVFIVVVLAAVALGASQAMAGDLSLLNIFVDVFCIAILIAAWALVYSEVVRPANALAEIASAFTHGGEDSQLRGRGKDGAGSISLWTHVETFAGVLHAQTHTFDDAVAVERVVLREVNHRIRNNLQMVASILAIQARADETDGALRAHDRINLLSLAHDRIYAAGDVHDVRLDDLAAEIGRTLLSARGAQARRVRLKLQLAPARAKSDSAVPMAFLMGESLSHALDVLSPVGEAVLVVALHTQTDGAIIYSLSSPQTPENRPLLPNARRVMDAFALQLGAEIAHSQSGAEIVRIKLISSADGEAR